MQRYFNAAGVCNPKYHYMVDIQSRLKRIKMLIDRGSYFTINRARQYGKTTTLMALRKYLSEEYVVVSMDFQLLSHADFESESSFITAFSRELLKMNAKNIIIPEAIKKQLEIFASGESMSLKMAVLFDSLNEWCSISSQPLVLMIDEVDSATNNQVFLDFLAQLRGYYMHREEIQTFQSVILAGVHDVKNIKRKIRPDDEHLKVNSPWNIAADFNVDMSFSPSDIAGMLQEYENDYHTGMDIAMIARMIYEYTSGYPFLVSRICKIIDEQIQGSEMYPNGSLAWSKAGFLEAIKLFLSERNSLFESLTGKLNDYPELESMMRAILFGGQDIPYNPDNYVMDMARMFGFVKMENGLVVVSNRIFETRLYNMFLTSSSMRNQDIYRAALHDKNQFIQDGQLNVELILEKFVLHFDELYGDQDIKFIEEDGRRYFLLYLRPIINGTGNYYVEARTRNMRRTDVIIDYRGKQWIIELKIWHGNEYNSRGEKQLLDYLDYYQLKTGYMLSFNFNKKKQIGIKHIEIGDKMLIEAVV